MAHTLIAAAAGLSLQTDAMAPLITETSALVERLVAAR